MEPMNVMVVADSKYILPMITMLCSMFENNPEPIDVYLFQTDINAETIDKLIRFCQSWENKNLINVYIPQDFVTNVKTTVEFPKVVYYKLLCASLLPESIHKIICMDLDMVVKKSLRKLYDTDIEGYPLAACKDVYGYIFNEAEKNIERLELKPKQAYFNAGFMMYNLDYIRKSGHSNNFLEMAKLFYDKLKWPEQDILNMLYIDKYLEISWADYNCPAVITIMKNELVVRGIYNPLNKIEIEELTDTEGYADYTEAMYENAAVIHYIGETKPWNKNRPASKAFEIYDREFFTYSGKAFEIYKGVS